MKASALNGNVQYRHRFVAVTLGGIIVLIATMGYTAGSHDIRRAGPAVRSGSLQKPF